jgi:long-chain acyl-CoA synthetase
MTKEEWISPQQAVTLDGLFRQRVQRSPEATAYLAFDKATGDWAGSSWRQIAGQVARWQAALAAEGLQPGDAVALALRNGPAWVVFEQAALGLGLVVVPLYPDDRADNLGYILEHAGVKLLLIADDRHWRRLCEALAGLEELRRVLLLGAQQQVADDDRLRLVERWLPAGDTPPLRQRDGAGDDLATIVYTSGTTGRPKGVMLSHANILANAYAPHREFAIGPTDRFLSFLPLSHMLERTVGYYLPMMAGASVAYARSVNQLAEDLASQRPTVLISVPRVFERLHGRLQQTLQRGGALPRWLFGLAVAVGWRHFQWRQGRQGWSPQLLLRPLLQPLVGDRVLARLGGCLRLVVTGGAALSAEVARVFAGLGLDIVQGYGLTETSPVVSCNRPQCNYPETVGPALPGVEVRIGADDELLVRGPSVMLGYWDDLEASAQVLDRDGWFHTGDQARIGAHGHIAIVGRIKDILVLSNGEKVPPGDMELAIIADPLFEQVMVLGEGRPFLAALVVLNPELWRELAGRLGLDADDREALADKRAQQALVRRIAERCRDFPGYAKIRAVHADLQPWSVDNGLLTPTLKVRRKLVLERFAADIEALYRAMPGA